MRADISDERLLEKLKEGEQVEQAFGILVDRYAPRLYAVIRRILYRHEDADDVLQNTFIKIWQNIHTFRGHSKLSTWMYTIATNEALSHLRRERPDRKLPITTEEYDLTQLLQSDPYFDGDAAEAAFLAAVEELPEKQKLTFQLRYFEDLSYREISEITGTSEGALKANYHHATKKIKAALGVDQY